MYKKLCLLACLIVFTLTSCTVKEKIVFNEDGTGNFILSYDMGNLMKEMKNAMGGGANDTKEKKSKVMDTTMVFSEIMETYKDSVAALPEEKRLALEAVKDMYMKMKMDEANGVFDFGVGLNFESIEDLKGIQEKIEKAKSLNAKNDQVGAMKEGSPLGKFMQDDKNGVDYNLTTKRFSRITKINKAEGAKEITFDEEGDKEFLDYFKESFYTVEYTFPKQIKSYTIEGASLSEDRRTISYKASWVHFLQEPKALDIAIEFEDE